MTFFAMLIPVIIVAAVLVTGGFVYLIVNSSRNNPPKEAMRVAEFERTANLGPVLREMTAAVGQVYFKLTPVEASALSKEDARQVPQGTFNQPATERAKI